MALKKKVITMHLLCTRGVYLIVLAHLPELSGMEYVMAESPSSSGTCCLHNKVQQYIQAQKVQAQSP